MKSFLSLSPKIAASLQHTSRIPSTSSYELRNPFISSCSIIQAHNSGSNIIG